MKLFILVARVLLGGLFFGHGAQKLFGWFGGYGPEGTGGFLESLGVKPGRQHAMAAGASEMGGGALLAAGLATPAAAAAITGVMTTAIRTVHQPNGPWISENGWEYTAVVIAAVLTIVEVGPGPVSLDAALRDRAHRPRLGAGRARRRRRRVDAAAARLGAPRTGSRGRRRGLAPLEGQPDAEPDQHRAGEALGTREPRALDEGATRASDERRRAPSTRRDRSRRSSPPSSSADGSTGAPAGTNCGKRATKKTASLGLARLVTRPSRSGAPRAAVGRSGASRWPRSDCKPSRIRTTAPASLTVVKAAADVATTAAIPIAAKQPHASTPSELPTVVASARRRPPVAALRTTSAVAAPGRDGQQRGDRGEGDEGAQHLVRPRFRRGRARWRSRPCASSR